MKNYRVLVCVKELKVLPNSGKRREAVINFIDSLEHFSDVEPDFETSDPATARIYNVNSIAGFTIFWWHDGADDDIKIVKIRPKDQI